jgi:hypothetical protein
VRGCLAAAALVVCCSFVLFLFLIWVLSLSLSLSLSHTHTHTQTQSVILFLGLFAFCTICILLVDGGFGGFGHHFLLLFCGWLVL